MAKAVLATLLGIVLGLPDPEIFASDYSEVVVIPDVHGDSEALLRSLWLSVSKVDGDVMPFDEFSFVFNDMLTSPDPYDGPKLSEKSDVALVQLGDIMDRGPYGVKCHDILMLVSEIIGWRYLQLYGNHELLNHLDRADEYISRQEWGSYPTPKHRRDMFAPGGRIYESMLDQFLGFARISTSSKGQTAGTLFVHGGIDLPWLYRNYGVPARGNLVALNSRTRELLQQNPLLLNEMTSFLWTRDLAEISEDFICDLAEEIAKHFKVVRIIVGHTPQEDRQAKIRCGGLIVLADVMMSRWMTERNVQEDLLTGGRPVSIILKINRDTEELESMIAHYIDLQGGAEESVTLFPQAAFTNDLDEEQVDMWEHRFLSLGDEEFFVRPPPSTSIISLSNIIAPKPVKQYRPIFLAPLKENPHPVMTFKLSESCAGHVYESRYNGRWGVVNLWIDGRSEVAETDVECIGGILGTRAAETGSLEKPELSFSVGTPYLFIETMCTVAVSDIMNVSIANRVRSVVGKLHEAGVLLGRSDSLVRAFATDRARRLVELIDWTTIKAVENPEQIEREKEALETEISILLTNR